jgi:hypothetical protein
MAVQFEPLQCNDRGRRHDPTLAQQRLSPDARQDLNTDILVLFGQTVDTLDSSGIHPAAKKRYRL